MPHLAVQSDRGPADDVGVEIAHGASGAWPGFAAHHSPDALLVVDSDGTLLWGSPSSETLLGHDPATLTGTNVFERVHPDDLGYAAGALHETVRKDGLHIPVQIRVAHADGHWVDVEITANTPASPDGSPCIVLSLRTLDPRLVLPERRREFEEFLDGVSRRCAGATWQAVAGIVTDALAGVGELFHASRALFALVDHDDESVRVQAEWSAPGVEPASHVVAAMKLAELDWSTDAIREEFTYTEDVEAEPERFASLRARLDVHSKLIVPVAPDGVLLAVLVIHWAESGDPYWDDALGTCVQAFGQILTATVQRSRSEAVVHHRSLHDPLTGLANRSQLLANLRHSLGRLTPTNRSGLALLYCDLDGFKEINDEHGHDVGDRVLIDIANRIRSQLRPGDLVGRLGGDEFVVLCHRIEDRRQIEDVASRIRTAVASRPPAGLTDRLDVSIGIAWTNERRDADELLREADRQMYAAKQHRRAGPPGSRRRTG